MNNIFRKEHKMAKSSNYTIDKKYWYCADFETTTPRTQYYKDNDDVCVILSSIQKYGDFDSEFINHLNIRDFMNYFINLGKSSTIFFHNLSFDGDFIIKYLVNHTDFKLNDLDKTNKKQIEIFKSGNTLYSIVLTFRKSFNGVQKKIRIIFRCSYKLLNSPIRDLGRDLGMDKYHGVNDLKTFYDKEPFIDFKEIPDNYLNYCNQDVLILNKSLSNLELSINKTEKIQVYRKWKNFNIFHSLTIGSLAISIFKNIYLPQFNYLNNEKIKFKIDSETYKISKNFFTGGFTQFNDKYLGQPKPVKNGKFYDVKSAYPFQMTKDLPHGKILGFKPSGKSVEMISLRIKSAKIKPQYNDFVILRNWNLGEGRYTRELKNFNCYYYKEEWDIIKKVYDLKIETETSFFMKKSNFMENFIRDMYFYKEDFKKKNQKSFSHSFKILLNSSYGKLATREKFNNTIFTDRELEINESIVIDKKQYRTKYLSIANNYGKLKTYIMTPEKDKKHLSNIAAAGYITALERVYLFKQVLKVGTGKFIYSDTDSIAFENPNEKKIKVGKKLGDWELEKEFDYFGTYGAKKYLCYNKDKIVKVALSGININNFKTESGEWNIESFKSFNFDEKDLTLENATLEKRYCNSGIALLNETKKFMRGKL